MVVQRSDWSFCSVLYLTKDRLDIGNDLSVHDIAYVLKGQRPPWRDDFTFYPLSFSVKYWASKM